MPDGEGSGKPPGRRESADIARVENKYLQQVADAVVGRTHASLVSAAQNMLGKFDDVYVQLDMAKQIVEDALYHAALKVQEGRYNPNFRGRRHGRLENIDPARHLNAWVYPTALNYMRTLRRKLEADQRARRRAVRDPTAGFRQVESATPELEVIRRESEEDFIEFAKEALQVVDHMKLPLRIVFARWIELTLDGRGEYDKVIEAELFETHGISRANARVLVHRGNMQVRRCLQRIRCPEIPQPLHFIVMMRYANRGVLREHPLNLLNMIADEARSRIECFPQIRDVIVAFLAPQKVVKVSGADIRSILNKVDKLAGIDGPGADAGPEGN